MTDDGVGHDRPDPPPREEVYVTCRDYREVAEAIRSMVIRGAPAIGVAAAMGRRSRRAPRGPPRRGVRHHLRHARANPPHRRQPVLGHRAHEAACTSRCAAAPSRRFASGWLAEAIEIRR